jgi:hypothetical protein
MLNAKTGSGESAGWVTGGVWGAAGACRLEVGDTADRMPALQVWLAAWFGCSFVFMVVLCSFARGFEVFEDRLGSHLGMAAPGWRFYLFEVFEEISGSREKLRSGCFASVGTGRSSMAFLADCVVNMARPF